MEEVKEWLDENGNKYKHPTLSAFVNNAVYEKLKEVKLKNRCSNDNDFKNSRFVCRCWRN